MNKMLLSFVISSFFVAINGEEKEMFPSIEGAGNFSFHADFLYWSSQLNGLDYASSGYTTTTIGDQTVSIPNGGGEIHQLGQTWAPGFRAGFAIPLSHDGWHVGFDYTWFQVNNSESVSGEVMPVWNIAGYRRMGIFFSENFLYEEANASWRLRWNVIDFELGKEINMSRYLRVLPYLGIKGYWGRQSFHAGFDNLIFSGEEETVPLSLKMCADEKSWGIGLRAGFDTLWRFTQNWGVMGTFAINGLWNEFNVTRKDTDQILVDGTPQERTPVWIEAQYEMVTPVIEFSMGLQFDSWFNQDRNHFGIRAAWEIQSWLNMNQFVQLYNVDGTNGNLFFQGLTLEFRFDY